MILTETPYRVSLFGGGTDYPEFYRQHGGRVLGMAIDKYCYVGVKRMPPGQMMKTQDVIHRNIEIEVPIKYRVQYSKVDDVDRADKIRHPAVRAALKYFGTEDKEALEFHCFGDLPGRAGLGGSSSFSVGLLHALSRFYNGRVPGSDYIDAWSMADAAISLERDVIKEAVGCQDQIFAAHGGLLSIEFPQHGDFAVRPLSMRAENLEALEFSLVLAYSGTMRDAHVMAARQIANIHETVNLGFLWKMTSLAKEAEALLLNGKVAHLGPMLEEAWAMKKELCDGMSNPDIDALYDKGMKLGATGGKLLGAGGGGFMLFFLPTEGDGELYNRFRAAIGVPTVSFKISPYGSRVIVDRREA